MLSGCPVFEKPRGAHPRHADGMQAASGGATSRGGRLLRRRYGLSLPLSVGGDPHSNELYRAVPRSHPLSSVPLKMVTGTTSAVAGEQRRPVSGGEGTCACLSLTPPTRLCLYYAPDLCLDAEILEHMHYVLLPSTCLFNQIWCNGYKQRFTWLSNRALTFFTSC
jgi:hypothetical protein